MKKYVFFDFNGTILDDVDLCLNLLNDILVMQGKETITKEDYRNIFCFPIKKYYEAAGIDFKMNSFEELSLDFIKKYQPASFKCNINKNLLKTVEKLKIDGYTVGILSASEINNLTEQLNVLGIYDKFDFVLGLDNIHAASKVEVAREFIKNNHINSDNIIFIGDTDHDALVSKSINAKCFLYTNGHQSRDVLRKCNEIMIDDFLEIFSYLK